MQIAIILISSLLGILVRFLIDKLFSVVEKSFPWKALVLNVLGCAFATSIYFYFYKGSAEYKTYLVFLFCFCLGFSALSSHSFQAVKNYKMGIPPTTVMFMLLSPALGALTAIILLLLLERV